MTSLKIALSDAREAPPHHHRMPMLHVRGSNMTSLKTPVSPTIYYVCIIIWVSVFAINGQRGPYSKRRRVGGGVQQN